MSKESIWSVLDTRQHMGATDPVRWKQTKPGTVRT